MSKSADPTTERFAQYSSLPLQQVDEVRRVSGAPGPALHVENELDAFGGEQAPLWKADGFIAARDDVVAAGGLRVQAETAEFLNRRHRRLVKQMQRRLERTVRALSPFVRRKPGQKLWFQVRTALLLLGDVAGQAGAQIYYGEIPELALIQALAAGVAVVTAGLIGSEVKDLRMAGKRSLEPEQISGSEADFAHLFGGEDNGKRIVRGMVWTAVTVGALISSGIFALRASIDGPLGGLVYGALAAGIAGASFISSYVYADEVADAIEQAEKDYERTLARQVKLSASEPLKTSLEHTASGDSITAEHSSRGEAAGLSYQGLKHRVLRTNPGVAGHSPAPDPDPVIGRRARDESPAS